MKPVLLTVWLGFWTSACSAAPAGSTLEEEPFFNHTFAPHKRALAKRDVWHECTHDRMSPMLTRAMADAVPIMRNMLEHLELALSLYDEDGTGELRADKATREQRNFDETNAISSYNMVISRIYWGPGDSRNRAGLNRLRKTREIAQAMVTTYEAYAAGTVTGPGESRPPDVLLHCDQAEYLSERNAKGLTYTQDQKKPNPDEKGQYWLSQIDATIYLENNWVPRLEVCALQSGEGQTRFGGVPASPGIKAHWFQARAPAVLVDETITFCPVHFDAWLETESTRTQTGLHYRNLHVPIGSTPTDEQVRLTDALIHLDDFTAGRLSRGLRWLDDFLVSTMIHESTHAVGFVRSMSNRLRDLTCTTVKGEEVRTTDPGCLGEIVVGKHGGLIGHEDAQAFAMYAMATWVNTVYWYRGYLPKRRPQDGR